MYLDTDDLVTSSIIAFLIAIVVFVFSIKAFRYLSPDGIVAEQGLSSHTWIEKPNYITNVSNLHICQNVFMIILFIFIINNVWQKISNQIFRLQDPNACVVCETLTHGSKIRYCDSCGIFVDLGCIRKANKRICCKILSTNRPSKAFTHYWNKCNYFKR